MSSRSNPEDISSIYRSRICSLDSNNDSNFSLSNDENIDTILYTDNTILNSVLNEVITTNNFTDNKDMVVCLNTRRSNISAYTLYKKMGYEHVAYIKNKYFLPNEDAIFMINDLTDFTNKNIA